MSAAASGRHVAILGLGYSAQEFARQAMAGGARVSGTTRDDDKATRLREQGVVILETPEGRLRPDALEGVTDLVISAPPRPEGCPALAMARETLERATDLRWIGYYSSTAVYGDCGGDWIDETRAPAPRGNDAKARLVAEAEWRNIAARHGAACDILRISGIYGPGRDRLATLRAGTAKAVDKPGQVFNRIHRDDIAGATLAAMLSPAGERLTNLADGHPCSSVELLCGLADMLSLPRPEITPFDAAAMPPGMAGFFAENRRLKNERLRTLPGFTLRYPHWRAGYQAIIAAEAG